MRGSLISSRPGPLPDGDCQDWILACIKKGDYNALICFLESINPPDWQQETFLAAQAALHLCRMCQQQQQDLNKKREFYQDAVQREKKSNEDLAHLLTLLMSTAPFSQNDVGPDIRETAKRPFSPEQNTHAIIKRLWERCQSLLGLTEKSSLSDGTNASLIETTLQPTRLMAENENAKEKRPFWEVYCFGSFQIYIDGRLIEDWTGNKGKSILKFLLFHPGPVPRDVLMETFWPGEDPESSRKNLYQAIYTLRQSLQISDKRRKFINSHNASYLLDPDLEIWVDSQAFQEHLDNGRAFVESSRMTDAIREYEAAIALYQGDFLTEDLYEDWLLLIREDFKNKFLDTLSWLCQYYFQQAQYTFCINYARHIIAQDHCREDAHRLLMRAYMKLGQRHLALKQYHQCTEYLAAELAVDPMPATQSLYQKIA